MSDPRAKMAMDVVSVIARLALAGTFIWACLHKIAVPFDFALQVATYQLLPLQLINLQAVMLPWIELVVGVALVIGLWTRPAALVTCGMNAMFIVAIALALSADLHLQCGCFSSAEAGSEMSPTLIVRDAVFLLVGGLLVALPPDRLTLDRFLSRRKQNA